MVPSKEQASKMDSYVFDIILGFALLLTGLILAYYGRKCVYQFRHIFGFLFGLAVFVYLLKVDSSIFQCKQSALILGCVAVLFGTLGAIIVHFISSFLTIALGFLLGSSIYSFIITFPYVYSFLADGIFSRQILFVVLVLLSFVFVYYYDYVAVIGSTAVIGAFLTILGIDLVARGPVSDIFFHGIQDYRKIPVCCFTWVNFGIGICTVVMGIFHQMFFC